ncbi:hypothetical protein NMY22_g9349 [Coprinellus aureogranulatus]|nr:hypothetical protein NMY22_g9349 [Coprinellus aureogranulatus]
MVENDIAQSTAQYTPPLDAFLTLSPLISHAGKVKGRSPTSTFWTTRLSFTCVGIGTVDICEPPNDGIPDSERSKLGAELLRPAVSSNTSRGSASGISTIAAFTSYDTLRSSTPHPVGTPVKLSRNAT